MVTSMTVSYHAYNWEDFIATNRGPAVIHMFFPLFTSPQKFFVYLSAMVLETNGIFSMLV